MLVDLSTWLHSLASVIFIGYYLLFGLIILPALGTLPENVRGAITSAVSKRSQAWLYTSLGVFALTGLHLMLVNTNYLGLGKFGNPWSILMLIKHTVVFGMLGIGFWFNAVLRVGPLASSNTGAAQALVRFRTYINMMAVLGAAVLLLTAVAQAY